MMKKNETIKFFLFFLIFIHSFVFAGESVTFSDSSMQDPVFNESNESHTQQIPSGTIRIEIEKKKILYVLKKFEKVWAYETFFYYEGKRRPLHEVCIESPETIKVLQDAKKLEFTYNGELLYLPLQLTEGILNAILQGPKVHQEELSYKCHAFMKLSTQNLSYRMRSFFIEFDLLPKRARFTGSDDWKLVKYVAYDNFEQPIDGFHLTQIKSGARIEFIGPAYPHFGIIVGPDLVLSKLGSYNLTVSPIRSLFHHYGGSVAIYEITEPQMPTEKEKDLQIFSSIP